MGEALTALSPSHIKIDGLLYSLPGFCTEIRSVWRQKSAQLIQLRANLPMPLPLLPFLLEPRLVLDAVQASAQAYRAFLSGAAFANSPESTLHIPSGWRYVQAFSGEDPGDFGPEHGPVIFGILLESLDSPGRVMVAIRGRVTHRGLWRPLVGPFQAANPEHQARVPMETRLEARLAQTYASLQSTLMNLIAARAPEHLMLTGHSMGGALALLLSLDVALSRPQQRCTTVLFASPRPGNAALTDFCRQLTASTGCETLHIVNPFDLIPTIPPTRWYGFAPIGPAYPCPFREVGLLPNYLLRHRVENYYRTLCEGLGFQPEGLRTRLDALRMG